MPQLQPGFQNGSPETNVGRGTIGEREIPAPQQPASTIEASFSWKREKGFQDASAARLAAFVTGGRQEDRP